MTESSANLVTASNNSGAVTDHTISCLVENHFGVLARISGLFSARGFNISSLTVGETEDSTISRMTIVVKADYRTFEQVKKQLNRLIDVIKVQELKEGEFLDRELLLVRVKTTPKTRAEVMQIASSCQARVADAHDDSLILEVTGDQNHITSLIELLKPFGLKEVVRTGRVALARTGK